jgi:hypothetical protein
VEKWVVEIVFEHVYLIGFQLSSVDLIENLKHNKGIEEN